MSWETQHRAGCEPNGQQRHSLPATTCFMQSYLVSILSWETQHRAAVAPTGDGYDAHCLQRHIFAILLHLRNETETRSQTHGLGHPVSDTRSRTHGLGHTVSDTRSRTHGVGHTVSDWIAMLQNKGNPPCGRTPTVLQPPHHLICTSTEEYAPRGVPHRFKVA